MHKYNFIWEIFIWSYFVNLKSCFIFTFIHLPFMLYGLQTDSVLKESLEGVKNLRNFSRFDNVFILYCSYRAFSFDHIFLKPTKCTLLIDYTITIFTVKSVQHVSVPWF
jgi:hypothetical protein